MNLLRMFQRSANPEFILTDGDARLPTHGSENAAGYDLYSSVNTTLEPGIVTRVELNIASQFRPGWVAHIWDRSSLAKRGLHCTSGVIDADYRGEWMVCMVNLTNVYYRIRIGDRIAQVVFVPCYTGPVVKVDYLSETARGKRGWGSTGR